MTIQEIQQLGYKVKIRHERQYYEFGPQNGSLKKTPYMAKKIARHCGYTGADVVFNSGRSTASVFDKDGNEVATAQTICSAEDKYNRKRALQIILGRVSKQL